MTDVDLGLRVAESSDPESIVGCFRRSSELLVAKSLLEDDRVISGLGQERIQAHRRDLDRLQPGSDDVTDLLRSIAGEVWQLGPEMAFVLLDHRVSIPQYDVRLRYEENSTTDYPCILTSRRTGSRRWAFLGRDIGIPVGLSSSVLVPNAAKVAMWSQYGFNIITSKTFYDREHDPRYGEPFWVEAKARPGASIAHPDDGTLAVEDTAQLHWHHRTVEIDTANSFGVPSPHPDEWAPEMALAARALPEDQLLIVSVGYHPLCTTATQKVDSAVSSASRAAHAGAHAVELNVSIPTLINRRGEAVRPPDRDDRELVKEIVVNVSEAIPGTPLVLKVGPLPEKVLELLLFDISDRIAAVAGVNCLQLVAHGFGEREMAGISGSALWPSARKFVEFASRIRYDLGASWKIIASGGVFRPSQTLELSNLGADAITVTTAALMNPLFARDCFDYVDGDFPVAANYLREVGSDEAERRAMELMAHEIVTVDALASELGIPSVSAFQVLEHLEATRQIQRTHSPDGRIAFRLGRKNPGAFTRR